MILDTVGTLFLLQSLKSSIVTDMDKQTAFYCIFWTYFLKNYNKYKKLKQIFINDNNNLS